jgi:hypothetical protein
VNHLDLEWNRGGMSQRRSIRTSRRNRRLTWRPVALLLPGLAAVAVGCWIIATGGLWSALPDRIDPGTRWATVATDVLNVRAAPSTESAVLDTYPAGRRVEVVGEGQGGFVPVRHGDQQAWMAVAYLAFDGSDPPPVADAVPAREVTASDGGGDDESPASSGDAAPTAPVEGGGEPEERWIDIDRGAATATLYAGDVAIASFVGRIGRDPSADGFYATAVGTYHVYSMNKGLAPTPFTEDTYLTDWVGFDPVRKNGIHSPVRDAEGNVKSWQNPTTLGCVRLEAADAVAVFDFAHIGMRVEVHD